jgi:hypothetical protein
MTSPGAHDWDRAIAGTILERWDVVRRAAERLELPVDPEDGPIRENWGGCVVRMLTPRGHEDVLAQRTGPVTAEVVAFDAPGSDERFYDSTVVFEPTPIDAPDEEDADRLYVYPVVHVVTPSRYRCYSIDGVRPEPEALQRLIRGLVDADCHVTERSDEDYEVFDEEEESERAGVYLWVEVPIGLTLAATHELFTTVARSTGAPLVWLELARALGDDTEFERQQAIAERFGL